MKKLIILVKHVCIKVGVIQILMQVLVVGATGETGKHIVKDLTKRNIVVTAVGRNLDKAPELLPSGVNFILLDQNV